MRKDVKGGVDDEVGARGEVSTPDLVNGCNWVG